MNIDLRTKTLLGDDFDKIKNFKIVVIGLGGVGSIVPISLVRTGVKNLIIVDKDKVEESNLNRQIAYNRHDLGEFKSIALKNHLIDIIDDIEITEIHKSIDESFDFSILDGTDYIVDCIDDLNAKVLLVEECTKRNLNIISSLGMGNKVDPSKVIITKLNKTTTDPLAKKFRYILRQKGVDISKIDVAFSLEEPIIRDRIVSSVVFVPNSAGLNISSYIIRKLIGWI